MLFTCNNCRRHVRADEQRCPFCDTALQAPTIRRVRIQRMSRTALLALGAALAASCSTEIVVIDDGTGAHGGDGANVGGDGGDGGAMGGAMGGGGMGGCDYPPPPPYGLPPPPPPPCDEKD
jgi:hypothetical protein